VHHHITNQLALEATVRDRLMQAVEAHTNELDRLRQATTSQGQQHATESAQLRRELAALGQQQGGAQQALRGDFDRLQATQTGQGSNIDDLFAGLDAHMAENRRRHDVQEAFNATHGRNANALQAEQALHGAEIGRLGGVLGGVRQELDALQLAAAGANNANAALVAQNQAIAQGMQGLHVQMGGLAQQHPPHAPQINVLNHNLFAGANHHGFNLPLPMPPAVGIVEEPDDGVDNGNPLQIMGPPPPQPAANGGIAAAPPVLALMPPPIAAPQPMAGVNHPPINHGASSSYSGAAGPPPSDGNWAGRVRPRVPVAGLSVSSRVDPIRHDPATRMDIRRPLQPRIDPRRNPENRGIPAVSAAAGGTIIAGPSISGHRLAAQNSSRANVDPAAHQARQSARLLAAAAMPLPNDDDDEDEL
jgi:hypothetical protein